MPTTQLSSSVLVPGAPSRATRRRLGSLVLGLGALFCLAGATACALTGASSGPPRQKGEPEFSQCVTGKPLEKAQNCGEYCAAQNRGCQNYGCGHSDNPSTRFGGASYDNELCTGKATRSYQCNEPFLNDGAVRCCCVGL